MPLFEDSEGVVRVLLTQRSATLSSHRGEMSPHLGWVAQRFEAAVPARPHIALLQEKCVCRVASEIPKTLMMCSVP